MRREGLLILQGGGAMGAFQCGAYKAIAAYLRAEGIGLAGIAGASIGALNGAVIARHHADPDGGAAALEALWREAMAMMPMPFLPFPDWYSNCWNGVLTMLLYGHPRLSTPNFPAWSPWAEPIRAVAPLHVNDAMERLIAERCGEFGPNPGQAPLLLVRAIDAGEQRAKSFHSWREALTARHIRASASIPLLYPFGELDGRRYWDGDLWPQTPLQELLAALQSGSEPAEDIGEYLVIVIDTMHRHGRTPASGLDLEYQVVASMFEPRVQADEDYARAHNRHLDLLSDCERESRGSPDSPLKARIADEYRRAVAARACRLRIVRIQRQPLPFEYVSRDFDYSAPRVGALIGQGFASAQAALGAL